MLNVLCKHPSFSLQSDSPEAVRSVPFFLHDRCSYRSCPSMRWVVQSTDPFRKSTKSILALSTHSNLDVKMYIQLILYVLLEVLVMAESWQALLVIYTFGPLPPLVTDVETIMQESIKLLRSQLEALFEEQLCHKILSKYLNRTE